MNILNIECLDLDKYTHRGGIFFPQMWTNAPVIRVTMVDRVMTWSLATTVLVRRASQALTVKQVSILLCIYNNAAGGHFS